MITICFLTTWYPYTEFHLLIMWFKYAWFTMLGVVFVSRGGTYSEDVLRCPKFDSKSMPTSISMVSPVTFGYGWSTGRFNGSEKSPCATGNIVFKVATYRFKLFFCGHTLSSLRNSILLHHTHWTYSRSSVLSIWVWLIHQPSTFRLDDHTITKNNLSIQFAVHGIHQSNQDRSMSGINPKI